MSRREDHQHCYLGFEHTNRRRDWLSVYFAIALKCNHTIVQSLAHTASWDLIECASAIERKVLAAGFREHSHESGGRETHFVPHSTTHTYRHSSSDRSVDFSIVLKEWNTRLCTYTERDNAPGGFTAVTSRRWNADCVPNKHELLANVEEDIKELLLP